MVLCSFALTIASSEAFFLRYNRLMRKSLSVNYLGKDYPIELTRKKGMRNIRVSLSDEGDSLRVSASFFAPSSAIERAAINCLPKLLKRRVVRIAPYSDGNLYYLGRPYYVGEFDPETMEGYLKKKALPIFEERVAYYEGLMGVKEPYKVRARAMKSRYGVNSKKTHSITLSLSLIHYSLPIIDAVVVHELAHHYEWNHGKDFYRIVYRYCPEYKTLHDKLRKGIYE